MSDPIKACAPPSQVSVLPVMYPFLGHVWPTIFLWRIWGEAVHQSSKYSLFTVPASALILFSPTVAPASPCRVPREVKEFMAAPAVELGVEAATEEQKEGGKMGRESTK